MSENIALAAAQSAAASASSAATSAEYAATIIAEPNDAAVSTLVNTPASDTAVALSATYGRVLRPSAYGAVGDGVADDRPAFVAMQAVIAADPTIPTLIEITDEHYLSDGVSFDGDFIGCFLAPGSHVFNTAASSEGHCLGFIGHDELYTETTPTRDEVNIWGTGRVTGWAAGPNENAIGIVRFDKVRVNGPHLNAGHKGVTAQIGCADVEIRNITSDHCAHNIVSVEDTAQATRAIIEDITFGTCGERAIFASGVDVRVRRVKGDESNMTLSTQYAVHTYSPGGLGYVEIIDVEIGDTNGAKACLVSTALDFYVDRLRFPTTTVSPFEAYNCASGGRIGAIDAPLATGVTLSGTTVARKVKRTADRTTPTAGETTIPRLSVTSTSVGQSSGQMRFQFFEATKTETIGKVRLVIGGTVPTAGTITLNRVGVYEVDDEADTATLIASTASTTTDIGASTIHTRALTTSFTKRAGKRYAVAALLVYSGGSLTLPGVTTIGGASAEAALSPRLTGALNGQADLPASVTLSTLLGTSAGVYIGLEP